jgi:hypothetical protein
VETREPPNGKEYKMGRGPKKKGSVDFEWERRDQLPVVLEIPERKNTPGLEKPRNPHFPWETYNYHELE